MVYDVDYLHWGFLLRQRNFVKDFLQFKIFWLVFSILVLVRLVDDVLHNLTFNPKNEALKILRNIMTS